MKIFLGFIAILFLTQAGYDFMHSKGFIQEFSQGQYATMAYADLVIGCVALYFLGSK